MAEHAFIVSGLSQAIHHNKPISFILGQYNVGARVLDYDLEGSKCLQSTCRPPLAR